MLVRELARELYVKHNFEQAADSPIKQKLKFFIEKFDPKTHHSLLPDFEALIRELKDDTILEKLKRPQVSSLATTYFFHAPTPIVFRKLSSSELDTYLQLSYDTLHPAIKDLVAFHPCVSLTESTDLFSAIKKMIDGESINYRLKLPTDTQQIERSYGKKVRFIYIPICTNLPNIAPGLPDHSAGFFSRGMSQALSLHDLETTAFKRQSEHFSCLIVEINEDQSIKKIHHVDCEPRGHRARVTLRILEKLFSGHRYGYFVCHNQNEDGEVLSGHYVIENISTHITHNVGRPDQPFAIRETLRMSASKLIQIQQDIDLKLHPEQQPAAAPPDDGTTATPTSASHIKRKVDSASAVAREPHPERRLRTLP